MFKMEELINLLHKLSFWQTTVCNCKKTKIEDLFESCKSCNEKYFTYDKGLDVLKIYIIDEALDNVRFDIKHLDDTVESNIIYLKDIKDIFYKHTLIKPLITKSKIKSINQMNEDSMMEKYITEFRDLINLLGFELLDSGSTHSDIFVLNIDEMHYNIIINNVDINYSNSEKIEITHFNKITNKRGGLNWHVKSNSVRQAIDKFFYYLPKLKPLLRKKKIEKILNI